MAYIRTRDGGRWEVEQSVSVIKTDLDTKGHAVLTQGDGAVILVSLAGVGWVELDEDSSGGDVH